MAGSVEIWAARLWNVLNEGRPFALVFPLLALVAAVPLGLAPDGSLALALAGALAFALALAPFSFPLRGRALLWLALAATAPLLEPWRAPGLIAGALAGYAFFTVLVWGTLYYRLRTGAPWTNFLRFWRLVLTNSDPTSGNALEQVPKVVMALSAGALLAEEPGAEGALRLVAAALVAAALGALAWRRFARRRLPAYPPRQRDPAPAGAPLARRVYVIVIDGCNRERLWQARTPVIDRLAREGTEYLQVEPAHPARTVVCFSSMLTGATPAEHGMRSNFAPRLGVRREALFDVLERHGRRGRLVGIAHLLDPFGDGVVRPVTSVQPTERIDGSLCAAARRAVEEEDPDLLVLQLLAADQIGHVRGTRNRDYVEQLERTDRAVGDFLAFLGERGKLDGATVILMADHGQGRGIGGHGHLDWGERPVPFVVHGAGAVPGAISREPRSILELAATVAALLDVERPAAARGRPLVPALEPALERPAPGGRCLAIVVARDEEPAIGGVLAAVPREACGMPLDVLVVDDGSRDRTAAIARAHGAEVHSHACSRGVGAALRTGLELARERGYAAAAYIDGDGEYDAAEIRRVLEPVARGRADYVCGSRFLGTRDGMSWHRSLANRTATSLMATLMETVLTDTQSGLRAFSARALASARIRHDYNYAQVLTLSLWGAGIDSLELPISYARRRSGRSFVRYPEYLARVTPAVWREWRASRATRRSAPAPTSPASTNGQTEPSSKSGRAAVTGPNGASGRSAASPPPPTRTSR
jgi:Glycosyl transferase family 2/Type I phosphodiesterase / nucleotide pyrophosphatase